MREERPSWKGMVGQGCGVREAGGGDGPGVGNDFEKWFKAQ